jgi:hypothetical protein
MSGSRILLLMVLGLVGCRPAAMPMPDVFPAAVGAWHRVSVKDLPAGQPPDAVPAASIERVRAAVYEGAGKVEARVYQFANPAVALDVMQRWTQAPDTVAFQGDRFFVVIRWEKAERKSLQEFVRELEKKFPTKPGL